MDGDRAFMSLREPRRDVLERYASHMLVYNRCVRWGERVICEALAQECEDALIFVERSILKMHWVQKGELSQGLGRSCGGRRSLVHTAVDDLGRPVCLDAAGAQTHDGKAFGAFLGWTTPLSDELWLERGRCRHPFKAQRSRADPA